MERASTLLLNIPSDQRGLFHENDNRFSTSHFTDGESETYWHTGDEHRSGTLEIDLGSPQTVKYRRVLNVLTISPCTFEDGYFIDLWGQFPEEDSYFFVTN